MFEYSATDPVESEHLEKLLPEVLGSCRGSFDQNHFEQTDRSGTNSFSHGWNSNGGHSPIGFPVIQYHYEGRYSVAPKPDTSSVRVGVNQNY